MTGTVFNIQKFCVNDGPGIRTTVFLKGCPLHCMWCHNPESNAIHPEIFYVERKCISCGCCVPSCPKGCHTITPEGHLFDRKNCIFCGQCATVCIAGALEQTGKTDSIRQVLDEVCKDKLFYDNSGGGLTVSGGEPMAQYAFTYELLKQAKARGLHTCMETCGFAPEAHFRQIAPLVDLFLFDYKETDSALHERFTGVSNERILENLRLLNRLGAQIILRCPIIPTLNDRTEHFAGIAETANRFENIRQIHIEPYHPLGQSKSQQLGKAYPLGHLTFPEEAQIQKWIDTIAAQTATPVLRA